MARVRIGKALCENQGSNLRQLGCYGRLTVKHREPGNVRAINWLGLVPRTPRIGDRSKPRRQGHSAGFCFDA